MKNKKSVILGSIILLLLFISGCDSLNLNTSNKQSASRSQQQSDLELQGKGGNIITYTSASDLIAIPDKIIYYHQSKQTIIDNKNNKFDTIIKMTKDRASKVNDVVKTSFSQSEIETFKQNEDILEFVYSENIVINWKRDINRDFLYNLEYNTIIFPLTGEKCKMMIFLPTSPGPLVHMGSADELIKVLNQQ